MDGCNSKNELCGLRGYIELCDAGTHHAEKHILREMCTVDQQMLECTQSTGILQVRPLQPKGRSNHV